MQVPFYPILNAKQGNGLQKGMDGRIPTEHRRIPSKAQRKFAFLNVHLLHTQSIFLSIIPSASFGSLFQNIL
jgi:hypothetical protein